VGTVMLCGEALDCFVRLPLIFKFQLELISEVEATGFDRSGLVILRV